MKIDCVSDFHGHFPKLEGGDLLIVAGDLTARDEWDEHIKFADWLKNQKYKKKIVIAGNHDNHLFNNVRKGISTPMPGMDCEYLCDSGTEFKGLKIWGSPWTAAFEGMNPKCMAFTGSEDDLQRKYDLIPNETDILITHSPPYGFLDTNIEGEHCGSKALLDAIATVRPKLVCFGHIHENGSNISVINDIIFVNASHVNENYEPVNKPVRIEL